MRVGRGRLRSPIPLLMVPILAITAGCATVPSSTGLPAFPAPAASAGTTTGPSDVGVVPDDCTRVLTPGDLGAVLGLPLGSVAVRTVSGVPAPKVGRTERLDCSYTQAPPGGAVLAIRAAAYADAAAARAQWRLNAEVEGGAHRDIPIGAASSVLVERPGEALLTVVYGSGTLTFTLPGRPFPVGRPAADVLVDLALRTLPAMAKAVSTASAAPASTPPRAAPTAAPARAAGASS